MPDNNIRNFSDKYEREIIKIKKMKGYKKKINLRNEEIKQFLI